MAFQRECVFIPGNRVANGTDLACAFPLSCQEGISLGVWLLSGKPPGRQLQEVEEKEVGGHLAFHLAQADKISP